MARSGDVSHMTDEMARSYRVAKVFRDNTDSINGMDFSPHGDVFVTSSVDESLTVYDVEKPGIKATVNSKKYGVENVTFTRNNNLVVHGSTKVDNAIRLLSLKDNKYLRYFPGHTETVTTIATHPTEDQFLSGSMDGTVRLWDFNMSNSWASIPFGTGRPVANYDPEGLVMAIGVGSEEIKLFDIRKIGAPFNTLKPRVQNAAQWTSLKFSPNGTYMLIGTNGSACYVVDAFLGSLVTTFGGYQNTSNGKSFSIEPCFSPDAQFVFLGSTDQRLHLYNINTKARIGILKSDHTGPILYTKFNPRYSMIATTCSLSCFWISTVSVASTRN